MSFWKDQPDLSWCYWSDPVSGESCLLIACASRCGYTFSVGSPPHSRDELPDIPLDQDVETLCAVFAMPSSVKNWRVQWLGVELLRRHLNRKLDPFWDVEDFFATEGTKQ